MAGRRPSGIARGHPVATYFEFDPATDAHAVPPSQGTRQGANRIVGLRFGPEASSAPTEQMTTLTPPAAMDFQGLFDASPNPYLVLDRRLHVAGANRAYLASVRRELDDIVGRWAWDAFPTDAATRGQITASVERVVSTMRANTIALLRFDVQHPEAEGAGMEERYWSITHTPVLDAGGEVDFVLQHPIDVTELQHERGAAEHQDETAAGLVRPSHTGIFSRAQSVFEANLALRASEERFRTVLQIETVGAIFFDEDGRISDANDAFLKMGGYTREDLETGRLRAPNRTARSGGG